MAPTPEFTFLGFISGRAILSVHGLTPYAYDPSGDGFAV